ncbi:hypothetical protein [uncultured Microbacterium sp.]|uniref:hypothetical protein n=1 Tax=uncultured Microbacterium sp. TaxID=191216 RepID=UPI0028EEE324|nr:hypothetical protein [uncultured Microbacterium sp.]
MSQTFPLHDARILGTPDVPVSLRPDGSSITLDSARAPHVQGTVSLAIEDWPLLDDLDPRDSRRMVVETWADSELQPVYGPWSEKRRNLFLAPRFGSAWGYTNSTAVVTDGVAEVTVGATAPTSNWVIPTQTFPFAVGEKLSAGYEVENIGTSPMTVRVAIWNNASYAYGESTAIAPGERKRVMIQGLTFTTGSYFQARLHAVAMSPGAKARISQPMAEKAATLGDYFDGGTEAPDALTRYRWLSATNNSASVEETRVLLGHQRVPVGDPRTFNLGIRSARPDWDTGTVTVSLASDEALLDDYSPLSDFPFGAEYQTSITLHDVVSHVLNRALGAVLEPGDTDVDITPKFEAVNMIRNPAVVGSTLNWSPGGGCTISFVGAGSSGYVRVAPAGATGAVFACDTAKWNLNCTPGNWYSFSLTARAETAGGRGFVVIRWLDANNDTISESTGSAFPQPIDLATVPLTISGRAPSNAVKAAPYFRFTTNRIYRLDMASLVDTTDAWVIPPFSGGDAPADGYTYHFEGPANDSPSVRTPLVERSPDLFVWKAGVSGLAFLAPIVQSVGRRLVCDEQRRWTLRPEEYRADGTQTYREGVNITAGDAELSRDDDDWFDGAVFLYSWQDRYGVEQERADVYPATGSPTKVIRREIAAPFPGPGRAEYAVRRAQGRGRVATVSARATWEERTEQSLSIGLAGAPILTGIANSVAFDLGQNTVTVSSRTVETDPSAWVLIPDGERWIDSPVGESWTEEIING